VEKALSVLLVLQERRALQGLQALLAPLEQLVRRGLLEQLVLSVYKELTETTVLRELLVLLALWGQLVLREPLLPSLVLLVLLGLLVHGALTVFPTLRLVPLL
jgi:hypothetical protein